MNRVVRKLQNISWEYDFDKNELHLVTSIDDFVISKAHTYSLGRFLVRIWQKLASKRRKSSGDLNRAVLASIEEEKTSQN